MVETIARETIEAIMQEVAQTPPDDYEYLVDEMLEDQPVIVYYLYELDQLPFGFEDYISFNEAERDYIFDIGLILWKVLKESQRPMHPVTWEELDAVVDETEAYFSALGQDPSEIPGAALQMIETHPEPELLRFIADAMRPQADNPGAPPLRPEYLKIVLLLFQIVLNAMLGRRGA